MKIKLLTTVLCIGLLSSCAGTANAQITKQEAHDAGFTCRSEHQKHEFDVKNGYPHGRPALDGEERWIVDHWCALECGGIDAPTNMIYQQYSDNKKKDKWERTAEGCKSTCNQYNSTPKRQVFNCK